MHATRDDVKIATIAGILDLCLRKTRSIKSHDYRVCFVLKKFCYQKVFRLHKNEKPAFSNSSSLKSVFEKLRYCDGFVWTISLTVEIKLLYNIPSAYYGRCLILNIPILLICQINKAVTEHKKLVETSGRLQRMVPDKDAFVENLFKARQAAHEVNTSQIACCH